MAASPTVRPVRVPPPDFANKNLPRTRQPARAWFRIHPQASGAIFFGLNPVHRYSHPDCPDRVLYLTIDPETCCWERFGDTTLDNQHILAKTQWDDAMISTVEVPPLS